MSAAVAKYSVTPVDTKSVDTEKAFEGEPMANPLNALLPENSTAVTGRFVCGTLPLEGLKAVVSIAASHTQSRVL